MMTGKYLAMAALGVAMAGVVQAGVAQAGTWQPVTTAAPFFPNNVMLLRDGRVMAQDENAPDWWTLTPDDKGSYINGSWHKLASMPVIGGTQYQPEYYASAVLGDGKVIVMGGEYNGSSTEEFSNLGAIYSPATNKWKAVKAPSDANGLWPQIGDAASVVLANGTFMLQRGPCLSSCDGSETALFNEAKLSWTVLPGTGMAEKYQDEQGYTLLRDGSVLTADIWESDTKHTEKFYGDKWYSAGDASAVLAGGVYEGSSAREIGPAVLRTDGSVIQFGATGQNSIYHPPTTPTAPGTWTKAPEFPKFKGSDGVQRLDVADGAAALLTNGNVLVAASPGVYNSPIRFYELNEAGTALTSEPGTPAAAKDSSYYGHMVELPTGQILFTDGSTEVEIYTPSGAPKAAWAPSISSVPAVVTRGKLFRIAGTQLNGLSQGAMYGDDNQEASDYPLVRATSATTQKVYYCATSAPSTSGISVGSAAMSTGATCPASIPVGSYKVAVVANGIASGTVQIAIQ